MRRKLRSSKGMEILVTGLYLPVFFHAFFINSPSASAEERTPFDAIFAPATGQSEDKIAIPLTPRINEAFIRRSNSFTTLAGSSDIQEPDAPTHVLPAEIKQNEAQIEPNIREASVTDGPSQPETLSSRQNTILPSAGWFADLLRLIGFSAAGDVEDNQAPEPDIATVAREPVLKQGMNFTPDPVSELTVAEEPETPVDARFLQQITNWFAENTEQVGVPDEFSIRTRNVPFDQPSPLVVVEFLSQQVTEPVMINAVKPTPVMPEQSDNPGFFDQLIGLGQLFDLGGETSDTSIKPRAEPSTPDPPANKTPEKVDVAPESNSQPLEFSTVTAAVERRKRAQKQPLATESAPEPAENADVELTPSLPLDLSITESPNAEPTPVDTVADLKSDDVFSHQVASVASVAPTPTPAPVTTPEVRGPTIGRKQPEPNFIDVVSSFFSNDKITRKLQPSEETQQEQQVAEPARPGEDEGTTIIQRTVVDSAPQSTPDPQPATPLVDAAIAEAKRLKIDPAKDTAFSVNIAVPVSDTLRIVEEKLILGQEGKLGRAMPFSDDPGKQCVRRLAGRTWICLESLGWPSVIADAFMARGVPEGRTKAIVRYDSGEATQYRVSFPASSFDRIRFHFEYLLGPPSDTPEVWVPLFAEPKRKNRVIRWVAEQVGGNSPAVLEMREIDDIRWMESPDKVNGVVRLYREGAKPIFSMIMTADLRLIEVRQIRSKEQSLKYATAP